MRAFCFYLRMSIYCLRLFRIMLFAWIMLLQEWSLPDDFWNLQCCQDIIAWACVGLINLMEGEACVVAGFLEMTYLG